MLFRSQAVLVESGLSTMSTQVDELKNLLVSALSNPRPTAHSIDPPPENPSLSLIPSNFKLPADFFTHSVPMLNTWLHWMLGVPSRHIPPLRHLTALHTVSHSQSTRLGELRLVMKLFQDKLRADKLFVASPTLEQVNSMFAHARPHLDMQESARPLMWKTVANHLREKRKKTASTADSSPASSAQQDAAPAGTVAAESQGPPASAQATGTKRRKGASAVAPPPPQPIVL